MKKVRDTLFTLKTRSFIERKLRKQARTRMAVSGLADGDGGMQRMLIDSLRFALERSECLDGFWSNLDAGNDGTLGIANSARPFMVAARFSHKPQTTFAVVAGEDAAVSFARSLSAYLGEDKVLRFPERADLPFDKKHADLATVARRMEAAHALQTGRQVVVVASARALLRTLPPVNANASTPLSFICGQELADMPGAQAAGIQDFDGLIHALESRGFSNTGELDGPGTFCTRGGTVDVYPGNLSFPVRLDFFGDELDEIRRIVPSTGQTISSLQNVDIYPVVEFSCSKSGLARARKKLAASAGSNPALRGVSEHLENAEGGLRFEGSDVLLPYLYDKPVTLGAYLRRDALSVLIEPRSLFDDMMHASEELEAKAKGTNIALEGLFCPAPQVSFGECQRATYVSIMRVGGNVDVELPVKRVEAAGHPDKLFGRLRTLVDDGYTVVFSAPNRRSRADMMLAFVDHGLPIQEWLDAEENPDDTDGQKKRRLRRGVVNVVDVDIPLGMIIPKAKLGMVSVSDTQGASTARPSRHIDITEITFPYKPGDYVVHAQHGIAHFKELVRREIDGTARDYLLLEYAEGDKLFVPVEQLDRVTRYVGLEGSTPRCTRLNTADWSRAMKKASAATKKLAFDLVDVYARRASAQGYAFGPDTPAQIEMEEAFPYRETPDQLAAIADVKADMRSAKPMDRLVCGDVGFGKTEVALRAAFAATQDKKQVMVLCPTTILAQQHFTNFKDRFEPFGVTVEVLSRFRTPQQQAAALKGFADGSVDVLVGTHRLLSRDVNPHDLGLVIIDEEQRFGVGHKESIKNMKKTVDVLTMSATPIPRTLHMSMVGIRDMSLLETPPQARYPVQTYVMEYQDSVIRDAILREIGRGGQVFFLYNRVGSIDQCYKQLSKLVPEARIAIAHGQMREHALEDVMLDFSQQKFDVLLCTTIIESGLDIPMANTLIIYDADHFGLGQLYQMRGRVGRSNRLAYAYFTVRPGKVLSETAQKRLDAIREFTEFGSGFRIAMRDLELRGAGNLLGPQQSGHLANIGYDLYCKLLEEAVLEAQGEAPKPNRDVETRMDVHVNAYLPAEYVTGDKQRLEVYKRIASITTAAQRDDVEEELVDRFGDEPLCVANLVAVAYLKAMCAKLGIDRVNQADGRIDMRFAANAQVDGQKLFKALTGFDKRLTLNAAPPVTLTLKDTTLNREDLLMLCVKVMERLLARMDLEAA